MQPERSNIVTDCSEFVPTRYYYIGMRKHGPQRGHPFMMSTRRGVGVRLRWTLVDGGQAPRGRPHRKLKSESTDVILSSSHAKKLASFLPEFRLWTD